TLLGSFNALFVVWYVVGVKITISLRDEVGPGFREAVHDLLRNWCPRNGVDSRLPNRLLIQSLTSLVRSEVPERRTNLLFNAYMGIVFIFVELTIDTTKWKIMNFSFFQ